jgi:hypothetical protein
MQPLAVMAIFTSVPFLALTTTLQAQDDAAPRVPTLGSVEVTDIHRPGDDDGEPVRAGIGHIIVLDVAHLDSLVRHADCISRDGISVPDCGKRSIVLYLDGREMQGIAAESKAPRLEEGQLQFHLHRTTDSANNEAWADLLGSPGFKGEDFYYRPVAVSVGLDKGFPLPSRVDKSKFKLIRLHRGWFIGTSLFLLAMLGVLLWLARFTNLLRDVGPEPTGTRVRGWIWKKQKPIPKPYSLGRAQMAFWFVLVIAAFLFIWLVTGAHDTITASVLGLIGIGAGTGLGAAAIDVGKKETSTTDLAEARAREQPLEEEIRELDDAIDRTAGLPEVADLAATRTAKKVKLAETEGTVEDLEDKLKAVKSEGIGKDILTDPNGNFAFHRFQMVVWTVVLGFLFLRSVWDRLAMPEFSATLLALLGISAGTYIGFKIPERKADAAEET